MRRFYFLAVLIWLLDFTTKVWAQNNLANRENVKVLGDFLQLTYIRNPGAAFSLASGATFLFTAFALCALIAVGYYAPRLTSQGWRVVFGLVAGGIFGNLTDRLFREPGFLRGHVIDWIQLPHWPVFNVADSSIVVAASLSIILTLKSIAPITPQKLV